MRDLKYIIVCDKFGNKTAIIFNGTIPHSEVVPKSQELFSAGFCNLLVKWDEIVVITHGEASSVSVGREEGDIEVIKNTLERKIDFKFDLPFPGED